MADTERVVKLLFRGDGRNLSATTRSLQRDLKNFEQSTEAIAQPLDRAFGAVVKLDAAAAALTATLITLALKQAGQFETAFNKTSAIIDTSDENIEKFRTDLLAYAQDSTQSLDSITNATFNAVSAGVAYKDVVASLGAAEKLATAGQADLNEVLQLVSKTINTYGLDTSEAGRLTEIFFETNKLGITTISELSASLGNVTPTAKLAGVGVEELAGAIATVTASTGDTSGAVTGLKALLSNIIKPTKDAADAAAAIGVEFNTTSLRTKGLQGFLIDLFNAADGNVDVLGKLFGSVEGLNIAALLGANTNGKYIESLEAIENSAGNVDRALVKVGESFDQTNQKLINNIEVTLVKVGDRLNKGYTNVANGIIDIFKSLGVSIDDGAFDELFDALDETADRLAAFLREVATSLPEALNKVDFGALTDAITGSGDAIASLLDGFDPSDPDDLAAAIQLVADSVASLIQVSIGFLPIFSQVGSFIKEAAREFSAADVDTQRLVGSALALAAAFVTLGPLLGTVVAGLASLESVGLQTAGAFQLVFGAITVSFNLLKNGVLVAELLILEAVNAIIKGFDLLPGGLSETGKNTQKELEAITATVKENIRENNADITSGAKSMSEGFGRITEDAGTAGGAVEDYTDATSDAASGTSETVAATNELAKRLGLIKTEAKSAGAAASKYGEAVFVSGAKSKSSTEEVDKFGLALRKITAEEFKAQLEFNAVEVKAQAEVITSAFDAIASSVAETTKATVGLVNALNEATSPSDRLFIIDQIKKQNEFQALGLQQQAELLKVLQERLALQKGFASGGNALELKIRTPDNIQGILEQLYLELLKDAKFFLTSEEGGRVITSGLI